MTKRLQTRLPPMEVHTVGTSGPVLAKGRVSGPSPSIAMTAVIKDALIRHYGKLEVAARLMGGMDKSQLSRDLGNGHFRFERLELLDDEGKAAVSKALFEAFTSRDPKVRAAQLIREVRRTLDELEDVISEVA